MSNSDNLFENERYVVVKGDFALPVESHKGKYLNGYLVINKATGVEEVHTPQLPDAIASAEQLDIALEAESWKWIRINFETESIMAAAGEGEEPPVIQ